MLVVYFAVNIPLPSPSPKKQKKSPRKKFPSSNIKNIFRKRAFLALILKNFLYFLKRKLFLYFPKWNTTLFSPSPENKSIQQEKISYTSGNENLKKFIAFCQNKASLIVQETETLKKLLIFLEVTCKVF